MSARTRGEVEEERQVLNRIRRHAGNVIDQIQPTTPGADFYAKEVQTLLEDECRSEGRYRLMHSKVLKARGHLLVFEDEDEVARNLARDIVELAEEELDKLEGD